MEKDVAVITGAGRGIGKAIAIEFAKTGAVVILCARTLGDVKAVETEIVEKGGKALAFACDVGEEVDVERFIKAASEIKGRIDVLVNNAGVAFVGPVSDLDLSSWEQTIRTNLTGPFLTVKHALKYMSRGAHIFNIASIAARMGFPNWSAYCASKSGLLGFTSSLREEVRGRGIKVTAVIPGPTDTPLWRNIPGNWDTGRMMKASDIARAIVGIYKQPKETLTEEIVLMPIGGIL